MTHRWSTSCLDFIVGEFHLAPSKIGICITLGQWYKIEICFDIWSCEKKTIIRSEWTYYVLLRYIYSRVWECFFNTKPGEQLPEHIDTRLVWPWHLPPTIWIQNLYVAIRTKLELVVFNKIIKCRRKAHIIHTFSISETHKLAKQGKLGTSDFRVTRGVSIICKSSSWKLQI